MQSRLPASLLIINCNKVITSSYDAVTTLVLMTIFSVTVKSQSGTHHLMITWFLWMWSCCTPIFTNYRRIIVFVSYFLGNIIFRLILSSKIYDICHISVCEENKDSLFHPFFFKRHCLNHTHRCTCIVIRFASEIIPPRGETGRKPNAIWV